MKNSNKSKTKTKQNNNNFDNCDINKFTGKTYINKTRKLGEIYKSPENNKPPNFFGDNKNNITDKNKKNQNKETPHPNKKMEENKITNFKKNETNIANKTSNETKPKYNLKINKSSNFNAPQNKYNFNNQINNNNNFNYNLLYGIKKEKQINKDNCLSPQKIINKNKKENKNVRIFSPQKNFNDKQNLAENSNLNYQNNNINNNIPNKNINEIINPFTELKNPPLVALYIYGKKATYISSALHCLANIRNIASDILKNLKLFAEIHKSNSIQIPITYSFCDILFHLYNLDNKNEKKYDFQSFYNTIIKINPIFKGKTTKNVIDFLVFFIDKLDEEIKIMDNNNTRINNILKESDYQIFDNYLKYLKKNKEDTIIFRTFAWINKKRERCWECNKEKVIFQKFFSYDLNIGNAINKSILNDKHLITIHDCIKYASESQTNYNIFCDVCNKKNNKDIKSTIYLSQNVLILLFREIEKEKNIEDMISNNIHIQIDKDIDLSDLVENEKSYKKYTLHGLILYNSEKNEYFAYYVSPIDGKWYEYTDGKIQHAEFNEFICQINYKILPVILFYRHKENK